MRRSDSTNWSTGSHGGRLVGWVGGMVSGYESLTRSSDSGVLLK